MSINIIGNANAYGLYRSQQKALEELTIWWNSNELEATLKGVAGTGKTFLLKTFLDNVVNKTKVITAPTHKALRVAEEHIKCKGLTLQSLHGLKPDTSLETFDIDNLEFSSIGIPKMEHYSLVVIDESSMINKSLFLLNRRRMEQYNVKVLYVGDPLQLPPVNEKESEVFHSVKTIIELDEIIRQGKDNPLLTLFELLREDIKNNTSTCLDYIVKHPSNIVNGVGYKRVNATEYKQLMLEYFDNDLFFQNINYVRAMAYTNIVVSNWNNFIRTNIFDTHDSSLSIYDLLTSYSTIVDENNQPVITNSEDYIIDEIRPYRNEYRLDVNCVVLKSAYSKKQTKMLQIVNHTNPKNVQHYINILSTLREKAIANKGKKGAWYPYYKFKDRILCMVDIEVDSKRITRQLDYGYALTVHKLQGSTFDNIFIDGYDICQPMTKFGKTRPNDINLRNRLLYVALSRAKNMAFIKF